MDSISIQVGGVQIEATKTAISGRPVMNITLDSIDQEQIISEMGVKNVLDLIGKEECMRHFDLVDPQD